MWENRWQNYWYNPVNPLLSNMISKVENTCVASDTRSTHYLSALWINASTSACRSFTFAAPRLQFAPPPGGLAIKTQHKHVAPAHKLSRTRLLHLLSNEDGRRELNRKTRLCWESLEASFRVLVSTSVCFSPPQRRLIYPAAVGLCEKGSQCDQEEEASHIWSVFVITDNLPLLFLL